MQLVYECKIIVLKPFVVAFGERLNVNEVIKLLREVFLLLKEASTCQCPTRHLNQLLCFIVMNTFNVVRMHDVVPLLKFVDAEFGAFLVTTSYKLVV